VYVCANHQHLSVAMCFKYCSQRLLSGDFTCVQCAIGDFAWDSVVRSIGISRYICSGSVHHVFQCIGTKLLIMYKFNIVDFVLIPETTQNIFLLACRKSRSLFQKLLVSKAYYTAAGTTHTTRLRLRAWLKMCSMWTSCRFIMILQFCLHNNYVHYVR